MNAGVERWPGETWYEAEAGPRSWPELAGLQRAEVAVIGAGLAGVSTALSLVERGCRDVILIDSEGPGAGASGRNGGFVFAGFSLGNERLIVQVGAERARYLHGQTRDAVRLMRRRIERFGIDCQASDAGVLQADWFGEPARLQAFAERMERLLDFRLDWVPPERRADYVRSDRYGGALFEPGSFHFHPLRYIRGLAESIVESGGRVFGDSPVLELARRGCRWRLSCPGGEVDAGEVVLATGGYDRRLHRPIQRAFQPVATYIAVTEPLGSDRIHRLLPTPVAVYDTRFAFDYYRPLPDTRLLWGGRISMAARSPAAIRRLMRRDLRRVFPDLAGVRFEFAWGGWMSYARHEMPLLGRSDNGLWYALAFGGHGMATTTLAGEIMAEALGGQSGRMSEFGSWPPRWAGGRIGRFVGQGRYWQAQIRDALRGLRLSARRGLVGNILQR